MKNKQGGFFHIIIIFIVLYLFVSLFFVIINFIKKEGGIGKVIGKTVYDVKCSANNSCEATGSAHQK